MEVVVVVDPPVEVELEVEPPVLDPPEPVVLFFVLLLQPAAKQLMPPNRTQPRNAVLFICRPDFLRKRPLRVLRHESSNVSQRERLEFPTF
jgi:hypothetical protein